jgi:cytochrome P450
MLAPAGGSEFSEREIAGNLFLFIFAGHETTASALVYIIHLLAIYPEWQDWAMEEVDSVLASFTDDAKPDFHGVYPECKRIRATLVSAVAPRARVCVLNMDSMKPCGSTDQFPQL